MKNRGRTYRGRKQRAVAVFRDDQGDSVKADDTGALCSFYRRYHGVSSVPVDSTISASLPVLQLPKPKGDVVDLWADKVMNGQLTDEGDVYVTSYGHIVTHDAILDNPLEYRDYERLKAGEWLNDRIITGFLSLLRPECVKQQIVVLGTQFKDATIRAGRAAKNFQATCGQYGVPVGRSPTHILIPCNMEGTHWFLVMYRYADEKWLIADSFNEDRFGVVQVLHQKLRNAGADVPESLARSDCTQLAMPRQRDSFQCGVWTCMYAWCLITGKRLPVSHGSNMKDISEFAHQARLYIIKTIRTNSLDLIYRRPDAVSLAKVPVQKTPAPKKKEATPASTKTSPSNDPIIGTSHPKLKLPDTSSTHVKHWADRVLNGELTAKDTYNTAYGDTAIISEKIEFGDYAGLQAKGWFNDKLINGFISLLLEPCRKQHIVVMSTYFKDASVPARVNRRSSAFERSCKLYGVPEGQSPTHILIPCHVDGGAHWVLIVYRYADHKWLIADSFNKDRFGEVQMLHQKLRNAGARLPDSLERSDCKQLAMPRQTDTYQCGVWTCMYAWCLIAGKRLPVSQDNSRDDIKEFAEQARLYIIKTVRTNSLHLKLPPCTTVPAPTKAPQRSLRSKGTGNTGDPIIVE